MFENSEIFDLFLEINCSTSEKTDIIDCHRNAKRLEWSDSVKLLAGRARLKSLGAIWAYSMVLSLALEDCVRAWPVKAKDVSKCFAKAYA